MYHYELYVNKMEHADKSYELKYELEKEIRAAEDFLEFEKRRIPMDQNVVAALMLRIAEMQEQIDKIDGVAESLGSTHVLKNVNDSSW